MRPRRAASISRARCHWAMSKVGRPWLAHNSLHTCSSTGIPTAADKQAWCGTSSKGARECASGQSGMAAHNLHDTVYTHNTCCMPWVCIRRDACKLPRVRVATRDGGDSQEPCLYQALIQVTSINTQKLGARHCLPVVPSLLTVMQLLKRSPSKASSAACSST